MQTQDTFYQVMRRHGVTRRSFLKFCSLTATSLGLSSSMIPQIAYALENKPRTPVIWLHGLECTCCTESFILKVPGCPPIPEVMSAVITYMLAFDRIPPLDRLGRPKMFYGQRIHDKCYRRAHFDAGQFVEAWDDEGARKGYCLYKMGCKGPTTYNACSTVRWNDGVSFPIQSGHGCLGCSEDGFWDYGSFYSRATGIPQTGIEATADKIGLGVAGVAGAAAIAHATVSAIKHARNKNNTSSENATEKKK